MGMCEERTGFMGASKKYEWGSTELNHHAFVIYKVLHEEKGNGT
jgi:hypothetical protein